MPSPVLSPAVVQQLAAHPLGGNVRELENLLHRAVAMSDGEALQVDFAPTFMPLPEAPPPSNGHEITAAVTVAATPAMLPATMVLPGDLQAYLDQQEREILVKALRDSGFNRTAAAQRLGLSLRQIRYRIARLAIAAPGGDEPDDAAA